MKELFDRHQERLSDSEDRRVWRAMYDATKRRKQPFWKNWRLLSTVATLATASVAVVVVLNLPGPPARQELDVLAGSGSEITVRENAPVGRDLVAQVPEAEAPRRTAKKQEGARGRVQQEQRLDAVASAPAEPLPTEGALEKRHAPAYSQIARPHIAADELAAMEEKEADPADAPAKDDERSSGLTGGAMASSDLDIGKKARAAAVDPRNGIIRGRVTTTAGEPLRYANVELDGTRLGALSDSSGYFEITDVPPGAYVANVAYLGYMTANVDISVESGSDLELAARLEESVTVITETFAANVEDEKDVSWGNLNTQAEPEKNVVSDSYRAEQVPGGDASGRGGKGDLPAEMAAGDAEGNLSKKSVPSGRQVGLTLAAPPPESRPMPSRGEPISVGGTDPVNGQSFDAMFFEYYGVNPFLDAEIDRFSTFAVDVDNASFSVARSYLNRGVLPPKDAIRVEEFINSFDHDYAPPRDEFVADRDWAPSEHGTFAIHLDATPSPFGKDLMLMRVGLKGREVLDRDRKPATLTFVVDVSGSMNRENRLGLVKRALFMLLDQMDGNDEVALVVYGSDVRVICPPTPLRDRHEIENAINRLQAGGSTYAEAGLRAGYELAEKHYRPGRINRVILCSDGVANVGQTGAEDILRIIKSQTGKGIYLTAVGFGMGNYNDVLMEKLANQGDGNYYYVDRLDEARKVFVENLAGTLQTIARDMKVQVEFHPGTVKRYRLIGYENRDVADKDFRNDEIDAGEVGAGHEVTALFEVKLDGRSRRREVATVRIRYEDPETGKVTEEARTIRAEDIVGRFENADPTLRMDAAVAEFAEILRHSYWAREGSLSEALGVARDASRELGRPEELEELVGMVETAWRLWPSAEKPQWNGDIRPQWEPDDDEDRR